MTREELEQNLGTIAHSGSFDFKKDNKDENIDIIGQFGVGFYSAFMVADKVTVISKAYGSDEAWQWESSGADGYELEPAEKETAGTDIILHIKPDTETDNYDNFLDEYGIVAIVKKYSDYVRYPIQMEREKSRQKPEPDPKPDDYKPEWETYTELETLNSMVPIWKKQKSEVTDEEYANFYKDKFSDYADPARVIVSRTEGTANYNALLFVPNHRPYDFYTKDYEKGLALYSSADHGKVRRPAARLLQLREGRGGLAGPFAEHLARNASAEQPTARYCQQTRKEDQERTGEVPEERPRRLRKVLQGLWPQPGVRHLHQLRHEEGCAG